MIPTERDGSPAGPGHRRGPMVTVTHPGRARSRWRPWQPWLSTTARLGLATIWIIAGATKVGDLAASGRAVNAYQVMPYELATAAGAALPLIEIALGVLLLVGLGTRLAAGISAALLLVFVAGIGSAWARGLDIDCGCFGNGGELPAGQPARYGPEVLRDLGFLVLAGFLLSWPRTPLSIDRWLAGDERVEDADD